MGSGLMEDVAAGEATQGQGLIPNSSVWPKSRQTRGVNTRKMHLNCSWHAVTFIGFVAQRENPKGSRSTSSRQELGTHPTQELNPSTRSHHGATNTPQQDFGQSLWAIFASDGPNSHSCPAWSLLPANRGLQSLSLPFNLI